MIAMHEPRHTYQDRKNEIRSRWQNADAHEVQDPERKACREVLAAARQDLVRFQRAHQAYLRALAVAQEAVRWLFNSDDAGLPFDQAATCCGSNPDELREAMFAGMDEIAVRLAMHGRGFSCPVCGAKR